MIVKPRTQAVSIQLGLCGFGCRPKWAARGSVEIACVMPTFTTEGNRLFVSYITGPSHVRLGLAFSEMAIPLPTIVCQPPIGTCNHGETEEALLVEAVAAGVAHVNPSLHVAEIVYVANDSPHYSLYRHCARLLAERFLQGSARPGAAPTSLSSQHSQSK